MKISKIFLAVAMMATISLVSCKPKDADVKAAIETALKAVPETSTTMVEVNDGVATITGECKDDASKAMSEKTAAGVKGVKSVINNCTVTPPPPVVVVPAPASLTTTLDEATQQKVKDGLKDIKDVTVTFDADKAILTGAVTKANRMKIMQMLAAAKVKSDVSKLTDK
ncbi:MAG: BON domain-containing protein [Ferruginibacter sp.]